MAARCLYVDEDAGTYYEHSLGTDSVTKEDGTVLAGFREEEQGATLRWEGKKEGFEDDKLCRVRRENEDLSAMLKDPTRESFLRKEDGTQEFWFELSSRFGRQLSVDEWKAAGQKLSDRGRKFAKIVGFDGGRELAGVPWEAVENE